MYSIYFHTLVLCGIPQSSVARIEYFQTAPNLATLLKLQRTLGLKLTVFK
ncbi:MAG: helix-turn-helix transcriptional regulator [Lachnospiraceae bacterium]|nr:helix-turn-helix transcriptional regulator [Lachnospiraceae bacterium]